MRIHILGICGTLMGSIAQLARQAGHEVTGTDENVYPPMSTQLREAGIALSSPYSADCIPVNTELVIIGNAGLPRGNPAVEAVLEGTVPYMSGAEWLGRELLADRWVIAIAGTHGKTTTTSMTAWILEHAGLAPGYLVGGVPANFGRSARLGDSPFFVIEADEYDTSYFDRQSKFLHYHPRTVVINNLEYDHADIFPDLAAIENQFHLLLRRVPGSGQIIIPADDANVRRVISRGCWSEVRTVLGSHADLEATDVAADGSEFTVREGSRTHGRVTWGLSGEHNVANGRAAIAAAHHAGVPGSIACEALCGFIGVKRRMEMIYESGQVKVYDDFAHHPTAINTTLSGLRAKVGKQRILAVVEPASHTMRLGIHADKLLAATRDADQVLWFKPPGALWDMDAVLNRDSSEVIDSIDQLLKRCHDQVAATGLTHLVIMSNGGFAGFHTRLIERLDQDR
jgi:UDP-N-acetylmuramate: L-alanyl-gamma-D-glutamyl-meso-diaminopimelate ligase